MIKTFSLSEINALALEYWQVYQQHRIWIFEGNMGAGKTTFIQALCMAAGVAETISSPTYSIINTYESVSGVIYYHMDWYRLRDEAEAIDAGVEEALQSGHHCFIEWPSIAADLLPEHVLKINLTIADYHRHSIEITLS